MPTPVTSCRSLKVKDFSLDRAFGLWFTVLGGIAAAAGAFLGFQASGGNVRDLTDLEKMKAAFKS